MRDILTTALERSIDAQMEESRKRGLSLKEMKEGKSIEEKRAEALDLISEKKKPNPFPQWNSIGEALERARGDKS